MDGATSQIAPIDLGSIADFPALPVRIEIDGQSYFLIKDSGRYQLLSTVCPHVGSEILDIGDCFECPHHGWRFEHRTGQCVTSPGERMARISVQVVDGRLLVDPPNNHGTISSQKSNPLLQAQDLTITLHAHACLEFTHRHFSLLTDPWLSGPAFLGAWTQYPPPIVDPRSLHPSAIWISHEHSDHFHEPTLELLDRSTPIYFPDFPNRRIPDRLGHLDFQKIVAMPFGQTMEIESGIRLTCYEPASLWNDAVVLIEIDGVRFLNLNDAGLNRRIARAVGPVDIIASSFSPSASGYPLTWTHLSDQQKADIIDRSRQGILRMLKEAVEMYGGNFVLPFAGHFSLWHPSHESYVRAMHKNTVDDVLAAFEGTPTRVIDLLPGESWHLPEDRINRKWKQRKKLYEPDRLLGYLRRNFDADVFATHHPAPAGPTQTEIENYFLKLNRTAEIAFCENLTVTVRLMEPAQAEVSFQISAGRLQILATAPVSPNLLIGIPPGILRKIILENLSWDEAHIGYWCRFSRHPDLFHAGFWRLLQAPYFAKPANITRQTGGSITGATIIADVLERFGDSADRIIRRYGLYCAGCHHSTADTIAQGAATHGLDNHHLQKLLRELNEALVP